MKESGISLQCTILLPYRIFIGCVVEQLRKLRFLIGLVKEYSRVEGIVFSFLTLFPVFPRCFCRSNFICVNKEISIYTQTNSSNAPNQLDRSSSGLLYSSNSIFACASFSSVGREVRVAILLWKASRYTCLDNSESNP